MKKPVLLVISFLIAGAVFAQEFTFRGLPWGSTVNDVITKERKPSDSYDNDDGQYFLKYKNIDIAGVLADLKFIFSSNALIGAEYEIEYFEDTPPHKIFSAITERLKLLYGNPYYADYIPKGTVRSGIFEFSNDIWAYTWLFLRTHIDYIYQITDKNYGFANIKYESPQMNMFNDL
jgi:hypothetical protein